MRELPGGTGTTGFSWRVVAKRRGLESVRLERAEDALDEVDPDAELGRADLPPRAIDDVHVSREQ